jgi:NO-binding membrane sensor protein with MHYT domain/nitrogen-specific signal transduction histidine kinase
VPGYFDLWTVLFSFTIAGLAGFVAFESIDHTRYSENPALWTGVGGLTLGLGIWSMHFIGMLAWVPPFPLYYSRGLTLLSILAAIASSCLAMYLTVSYKDGAPRRNLLIGAVVVGAGISGMHYLGMSALRFSPAVMWSVPGVLLSLLIAVMASYGAMLMLQRSGNEDFGIGRQVAASGAIGLAICGMHYTGMLAMMLPAGAVCLPTPGAFTGMALARVGVGNTLVFMACLLIVFYRDKVRLLRTASDARLEARESALAAERLGAAGRIAASIAHEINNPLEAVTNLLYLAQQGTLGAEERGYLQQAQDELRRVADITTHTLKFYRQQGAPDEQSLPDLFESAQTVFSKRLAQSNIAMTTQFDPVTPKVLCRAGEIRQVFANLISTAIDAMPNGGSLLLVTRPYADGAEIEVVDTGEGISEHLQAKILDPFFTTKGASGTGLGLSICAEIMQRHGGSLRFTSSTTPGRSGTRFILYLPRTMAANA